MDFRDEVKRLFPGEKVELAEGVSITVRPSTISHIPIFVNALENAEPFLELYRMLLEHEEKNTPVDWTKVLPEMTPLLIGPLSEVLNDSIQEDVRVQDLPHWILPSILESWARQSFGDLGKLRPWVIAFENLIRKVSGKELHLWDALSNSLSQAATTGDRSKTTLSQRS